MDKNEIQRSKHLVLEFLNTEDDLENQTVEAVKKRVIKKTIRYYLCTPNINADKLYIHAAKIICEDKFSTIDALQDLIRFSTNNLKEYSRNYYSMGRGILSDINHLKNKIGNEKYDSAFSSC